MQSDHQFTHAILTEPNDEALRFVYADWLDDHGDLRGEFLRLATKFAQKSVWDAEAGELQRRLIVLRPALPPWWLSLLGFHRAASDDERIHRFDAQELLQRPQNEKDADGYETSIVDGVVHSLTRAIAYVERRSRWMGDVLHIHFYLHVRESDGRQATWEVHSDVRWSGCRIQFLEWCENVVLFVYREKHSTYICRFSANAAAQWMKISDYWVLDSGLLSHGGLDAKLIHCLRIPQLTTLPTMSLTQAEQWQLLPSEFRTAFG